VKPLPVLAAALALLPAAFAAAPADVPPEPPPKPPPAIPGAPAPGDRSEVDRLLERAARGDATLTDAEIAKILAATPHAEVRVSMIMLPVVVTDHRGRPIEGLAASDFEVEDLGEKRPINWFAEEANHPYRLALLLDVSESMSLDETRRRLEQALVPIGREVGLMDRIMLLSFSDQGVQQRSGWSDRPMVLMQEALDVPVHGKTAVVDALAAAAERTQPDPLIRQGIVLVTDGMDNASELGAQDVIDAARRVDVPIYVILLGGLDRQIQGKRYTGSPLRSLADMAEQSGGRFFLVDSRASAEAAAARIRDDLRHQYWLSFKPSKPPDGKFRPITVKVHHFGAVVRTRSGYR